MNSRITAIPKSNHPLSLLVIQATPFCNLDCSYCYLSHRDEIVRLDLGILDRILRNLVEQMPISIDLQVAWHAGEPLVAPIEFYRKAVELFRKYLPEDISPVHNFQTNGTLITDEWCDFFADVGAEVGLSLDGPKKFHDSRRVFRDGRGSFDLAMKGLGLLQKHRVPTHVICVLSPEALQSPNEFYDFLRDLNIPSVAFNCEKVIGFNKSTSFSLGEVEDLYMNFLRVFFRRRKGDLTNLRIREIDRLLGVMTRRRSESCLNEVAEPFCVVSVDSIGRFSTFSPELLGEEHPSLGSSYVGRFRESGIEIDESIFTQLYSGIKDGVEKCRLECEYFKICGGGSPASKLYENGSFATTETLACRFRIKRTADVLLEEISRALQ